MFPLLLHTVSVRFFFLNFSRFTERVWCVVGWHEGSQSCRCWSPQVCGQGEYYNHIYNC